MSNREEKGKIIKKHLGVQYEYHDVSDWDNLIESAMDEWASISIKRATMELPYAIGRFCEELRNDREYYMFFQDAIATVFMSEMFSRKIPFTTEFVKDVTNEAAKKFLDVFITQPKPTQPPELLNKQV